jgi:hypothetical protein
MKMNMRHAIVTVVLIGVAAGLLPAFTPSSGSAAPIHHGVNVELKPESGEIGIRDTVTWDRPGPGPIRFLLHSGLEIENITSDGRKLSFETTARFNPRHFWDNPDYSSLSAYDHLVEVAVAPPEGGWPNVLTFRISAFGVIADPLRSVGEEYGRSFDVTSGLIEERGVYLDAGSGWLPWVPGAATTFVFGVHAPRGWSAVSTGVSEPHGPGGRRIRIENPNPLPDLYLVAGPWTLTERAHGDVRLRTYLYGDEPELSDTYLAAAARYLDRYESLLGPYPFGQFALVENFWETGYGMPGFTLLGSTVIRLPFIVNTSFGHEILHCWWGNGVLVKRAEGNWCEGLTSYGADYAYREDESAEAARDYRRNQLAGYKNYVTGGRDLPLVAFAERHSGATQAIGYGKSMMVIHMLRRSLGDEAFFDGLRRFYERFRHAHASWTDLIFTLTEGSGIDPDAYRAQWIERAGAPELSLDMVLVNHSGGQSHVSGRLVQRPGEPYVLDVPVELRSPDGETILTQTLRLEEEGLNFTISTDEEVGSFAVDPDFDLFRRLHDGEIPPVLSQTLGADSTVIVVGGGGSDAHRAAFAALAERWGDEGGVTVIDESNGAITWDELRGRGVWILGESPLLADVDAGTPDADDTFISAKDAARTEAGEKLAWVITKHHPTDRGFTCSVMGSMTAEAIPIVGRKVPHYGKYSYLFFKGGTNVGKGAWMDLPSPLVVKLSSPGGS